MSLLSNSLWEPVTPSGDYVTNTPAGTISATTVQAAINELDTEKQVNIGLPSPQIYQDIQVFEYLHYEVM